MLSFNVASGMGDALTPSLVLAVLLLRMAGDYDDHDRWGAASGLGDIDDKEFSTGAGVGVSFCTLPFACVLSAVLLRFLDCDQRALTVTPAFSDAICIGLSLPNGRSRDGRSLAEFKSCGAAFVRRVPVQRRVTRRCEGHKTVCLDSDFY